MELKNIIFFIMAILLSCLLATQQWGDSGHAIGLISSKGGNVRHPVFMESGKNHYATITTLNVIPPFRGDMKIALEGSPLLDYKLYLSKPVIDLGIHRLPDLRDNILYGVEAGDKLALWTIIKPMKHDFTIVPELSVQGKYNLAFYDTATGKSVLKVPLVFGNQETRYAKRTP